MAVRKKIQVRKQTKDIPKLAKEVCEKMLSDLERAKRPLLEATKCSLDNSIYTSSKGYFTPGGKTTRSSSSTRFTPSSAPARPQAGRWTPPIC